MHGEGAPGSHTVGPRLASASSLILHEADLQKSTQLLSLCGGRLSERGGSDSDPDPVTIDSLNECRTTRDLRAQYRPLKSSLIER